MNKQDLSAWRTSLGLSKRNAAHRLGMSENAYLDMEAGRTGISARTELACIALWHRMRPGMRPWDDHSS